MGGGGVVVEGAKRVKREQKQRMGGGGGVDHMDDGTGCLPSRVEQARFEEGIKDT